ncbi:SEC-C domain-containing protein [Kribbella sp. NPDC056345]|uniref:SEC-C domain-containing protein n=1 Tax=Kribbella sp. NPDC056345 TaxID=3345789 RepID=UPI0035DDE220
MDDLLTDDFDCADSDDELDTFRAMLAFEPALERWREAVAHEERGENMEALIWYTRALEGMRAGELPSSLRDHLAISGRRRVRWALGVELDSIDRFGTAGTVEQADRYLDGLDALREPELRGRQVEVWSRSELAFARERWPVRITAESVTDYYREVERTLRRYGGDLTVVHRTADFFAGQTGQGSDQRVSWPPARNQACWCGSGARYKRCCGGEVLAAEGELAWGPARLRAGAELAVCRV